MPWLLALVQMCRINELPRLVFTRPFRPSELWFMLVFGLMLLVYHAQFMYYPQMSLYKSSKIYPRAKVRNFHLNRSCSLDLEMLACAIIQLTISSCVSVRVSRYWARWKFGEHERGVRVARGATVHTNERSINVIHRMHKWRLKMIILLYEC